MRGGFVLTLPIHRLGDPAHHQHIPSLALPPLTQHSSSEQHPAPVLWSFLERVDRAWEPSATFAVVKHSTWEMRIYGNIISQDD